MQLHTERTTLSANRGITAPLRCPHCDDWMVAPVVSEFVDGDEIRHLWQCDACGEISNTTVPLTPQ
jgi:hypothetical protein